MADDTNQFYNELKAHLEHFELPENRPKLSVTVTGIPHEGLTTKYQHPSKGAADPSDIASEAAKVIGAASAGVASGAVVGAVIGKAILGSTLARIGVASAGTAIGLPLLARFALVGGTVATVGYAAYKIGKGKRDQEHANELADRLMKHMGEFNPTVSWPGIEVYVSVPEEGLAALWQPQSNS
ncbi:MAG: hypothetical protein OXH22_05850 [Chloroflexi bacterium]|nr:hypothetical protein [Chloroflexota bacterium]